MLKAFHHPYGATVVHPNNPIVNPTGAPPLGQWMPPEIQAKIQAIQDRVMPQAVGEPETPPLPPIAKVAVDAIGKVLGDVLGALEERVTAGVTRGVIERYDDEINARATVIATRRSQEIWESSQACYERALANAQEDARARVTHEEATRLLMEREPELRDRFMDRLREFGYWHPARVTRAPQPIVDELRHQAEVLDPEETPELFDHVQLLNEAADEIVRLRAEVARLSPPEGVQVKPEPVPLVSFDPVDSTPK